MPPCLPGAQLQEVEGDEYRGTVKVKVGPITATFKGTASFEERRRSGSSCRAQGQRAATPRARGNANAIITAQLEAVDGGTHVIITTELTIAGRVAQFGRGALDDVSTKLLEEFAQRLETDVLSGTGPSERPEPEPSPQSPAEEPPPTAEPSETSSDSGVRRIESAEVAPVDLLDAAGAPLLKRLAPLGVAVAVVLVILWWRRR